MDYISLQDQLNTLFHYLETLKSDIVNVQDRLKLLENNYKLTYNNRPLYIEKHVYSPPSTTNGEYGSEGE